MDLKTITTTLALLGATTGCGGEAKKEEVKTETKTEVKTEVKTDVKEVTPATPATPATPVAADAKGEMKCAEGKCGGEGACGGKKTEGDGKAVPVDAAKDAKAGDAVKPAEKPADKT